MGEEWEGIFLPPAPEVRLKVAHGASRGTPALILSSPGGAAANVWDIRFLCRPAGACLLAAKPND